MLPILAGLALCWIWLCWVGHRFVLKYERVLASVVVGYRPESFPYNHRAFLSLGIIGFGAVYSPKRLAESMTQVLYEGPGLTATRMVIYAKIDTTLW